MPLPNQVNTAASRIIPIDYRDSMQTVIDKANENIRYLDWLIRHLTLESVTNNNIDVPLIEEKPPIVDSYGINEMYLDYYTNLYYNSGLENYDSVTMKPRFHITDGIVTRNSRFENSCSIQLEPGQYIEQALEGFEGLVDPSWYAWTPDTRYAFNVKAPAGGKVTVSVLQGGAPVPLKYWKMNEKGEEVLVSSVKVVGAPPTPLTSIEFNAPLDWPVSRMTYAATPNQAGGRMAQRIVNTGANTVYIDGFIIRPDWTGKYPGLYKPGPRSGGLEGSEEWDEYGVGDYNPAGIQFVFEQAYIYMPDWMKASWFVDAGGTGTEVLSPIDFRIVLVKETLNIDGVMTLCYTGANVMPFSDALPGSIVSGKISLRALCRGARAKPGA